MTSRRKTLPPTFVSDFATEFWAARERAIARARRDHLDAEAAHVAEELAKPELSHHVIAIGKSLGLPVARLRTVLALEVARARGREPDAHEAVRRGQS